MSASKKRQTSKRGQQQHHGDEDSDSDSGAASCLQMKFPRTRHLLDLGGVSRDDLLMDKREVDAFLASAHEHGGLIIEEKIDGANLGISMDPETYQLRYQNRSHFVTSECLLILSFLPTSSSSFYVLLVLFVVAKLVTCFVFLCVCRFTVRFVFRCNLQCVVVIL